MELGKDKLVREAEAKVNKEKVQPCSPAALQRVVLFNSESWNEKMPNLLASWTWCRKLVRQGWQGARERVGACQNKWVFSPNLASLSICSHLEYNCLEALHSASLLLNVDKGKRQLLPSNPTNKKGAVQICKQPQRCHRPYGKPVWSHDPEIVKSWWPMDLKEFTPAWDCSDSFLITPLWMFCSSGVLSKVWHLSSLLWGDLRRREVWEGHLLLEFQELQNTAASEGQVVVLECRVRGAPPLQVQWFRQGSEIQDSPDFRILQKSKERCPLSQVLVGFSLISRELKRTYMSCFVFSMWNETR